MRMLTAKRPACEVVRDLVEGLEDGRLSLEARDSKAGSRVEPAMAGDGSREHLRNRYIWAWIIGTGALAAIGLASGLVASAGSIALLTAWAFIGPIVGCVSAIIIRE